MNNNLDAAKHQHQKKNPANFSQPSTTSASQSFAAILLILAKRGHLAEVLQDTRERLGPRGSPKVKAHD
jgi:hypothetical protein